MKIFFFFFFFFFPFFLQAQESPEVTLSIRGMGAGFMQGNQGEKKVVLNQVDALGLASNPFGEVFYDAEKGGAYYTVGVELVTEVQGSVSNSAYLQVMRVPNRSGHELPPDALYDDDYQVKLGPGVQMNELRMFQPYVIRSNLSTQQNTTQRKLGVFISKDLSPGSYGASLVYSFFAM